MADITTWSLLFSFAFKYSSISFASGHPKPPLQIDQLCMQDGCYCQFPVYIYEQRSLVHCLLLNKYLIKWQLRERCNEIIEYCVHWYLHYTILFKEQTPIPLSPSFKMWVFVYSGLFVNLGTKEPPLNYTCWENLLLGDGTSQVAAFLSSPDAPRFPGSISYLRSLLRRWRNP